MEFKVGDLVEILDSNCSQLVEGSIHRILSINENICVEGGWLFEPTHLRLVEPVLNKVSKKESLSEFRVGDKVRILDNNCSDFIVDSVQTVYHIDEGSIITKDSDDYEFRFVPEDLELVESADNPEVTESSGGALRFNKGKPEFSHLSPDFILEMAKVMTAANDKYPYLNYSKKQEVRTALDSLMRHFLKFTQGHDNDEELGCHHLAMVAVNAMIAYQNLKDFGDEVDNRYSKAKEKAQNGD